MLPKPFHHLPEDFLHVIWREQYFNQEHLLTRTGEQVRILHPGIHNLNQGPDFLNAQIEIDGMQWQGQVEIHWRSEEWYQHSHHTDPHYNPTILHVVYQGGKKPIFREDHTNVLEMELKGRIDPELVKRYQALKLAQTRIPCEGFWPDLQISWYHDWWEELGQERLRAKASAMRARLAEVQYDWEQVLWEALLKMMGGPVNKAVFGDLAARLPYRIVRKAGKDAQTLEALIFGAGGWLGAAEIPEGYPAALQATWQHWQHKFQLNGKAPLPLRFSRMRPPQFPTFRLSQTAQIVAAWQPLSKLLNPAYWASWLIQEIPTSAYWHAHSRFGESRAGKPMCLGRKQREVMLYNVYLPLALAYLGVHGADQREEEIWQWLSKLPAEDNRITRKYAGLGAGPEHSGHSQGLIHLYKAYCQEKKCLHCRLGLHVLPGTGGRETG
ncbi:MAG: DUF2851 family protein [Bacteroidota bacterium]